jgi:hypothetical protein
MKLQTNVMSYGGGGAVISVPLSPVEAADKARSASSCKAASGSGCACNGTAANGAVDFSKMTTAQKMAYLKARWDRILG